MPEATSARRRALRDRSALRRPSRPIESLESRRLLASVANKLADINQTTAFLDPDAFTPVGNVTYFIGKRYHGDGEELWVTDGTPAGTRQVKDIVPGKGSSNPKNLLRVGNTLYFVADDGTHGWELWKSDGTESGTVMVKDIRPGSATSSPGGSPASGFAPAMIDNNGTLYFTATDNSGTSLFKSDGTEAGTVRVTTSNYSFASRVPLAAMNGDVYFGAGSTIYRTNSLAGAPSIITLRTFNGSSGPANLTVMNGKVYFSSDQDTFTRGDLFATNGTVAGTVLVGAVGTSSNSSPTLFTPSGNYLYFVNYETNNGKSELWRSDGTAGGTLALSTTLSINRFPQELTPGAAPNSLLFAASNSTYGGEIFQSNGTPAGTTIFADVLPGPDSGGGGILRAGPGQYYIFATKADQYSQLLKTNGTAAPTLVADLGTQFLWETGLLNVAGSSTADLLFSQTTTAGLGDLWRSSGSAATTVRVGTSNAIGTGSSMWDYRAATANAQAFVKWGTGVVFAADDGIHGDEVWINYPQTGETKLLADVNPGAASSFPNSFAVDAASGILYFQGYTAATGTELFRILPNGTAQVASDFVPGTPSSTPRDLRVVGSSLYYNTFTDTYGYLARFNTSTQTASTVLDAGSALTNATSVLVNGNTAIVSASLNGNTSSWKLYALNGSNAPTVLANGVSISTTPWGDKMSVNIGNVIYFVGYDTAGGTELWRSDGTPSGTYRVKDIFSGSGNGEVRDLTQFGGRLYFSASADGETDGLWTSDGTPGGTVPYPPTTGFTNIASIFAAPNALYVIGTSPAGVRGVYFLPFGTGDDTPQLRLADDATTKSVNLVGPSSFRPFVVRVDATRKYSLAQLNATSGASFIKDLWTYEPLDATMGSVWGLGRIGFLATNNRLYFPAYRPESGVEPYSYILDPIATQITGSAYWDTNKNGTRDTGEPAASGIAVYLDLDNDGARDLDEPLGGTNVNGVWTFSNLEIGQTYSVRLLPAADLAQSEPAGANTPLTRTLPTTGPQIGSGAFGLIDTVGPSVSSITVDRDASAFTLRVTFSEAINAATLTTADLSLLLLPSGNAAVSAGQIAVSYDAATHIASFTFPGLPYGLPPAGWLSAAIAAGGVADAFGNTNAHGTPLTFTALPGDLDGDNDVDFADLLTLAKNYNTNGKLYSQGNVDHDASGTVDFNDLLALAKSYNVNLGVAPPPAAAAVMVSGTPTRKRATSDVLS